MKIFTKESLKRHDNEIAEKVWREVSLEQEKRDITAARDSDNLGNAKIDKPDWLRFLKDIQTEQKKRKQGA